MKICFSVLAVLVLALKLSAAETNSPAPLKIGTGEADKHYDQEMIVTGKIAQVQARSYGIGRSPGYCDSASEYENRNYKDQRDLVETGNARQKVNR